MNVSVGGRFLEHDGTPFFYLADTAWKLFTVPSLAEAEHYLRVRREQGFTVVMPVLATERVRGEEGERSPFEDDDPDRPNDAYFDHADGIIAAAQGLGLWIALLPAWGGAVGGGPNDRPIFNVESARRYGAYVGRRYRGRDVIWVLGGDRRADTEPLKAVWRAMAAGLADGDGGRHLITFHPAGMKATGTSSLWFHDDAWLAFNMQQSSCRFLEEDLCRKYLADYGRAPAKPFLDGETRYENSHRWFKMPTPWGIKIDDWHVRQAAYYAMLCGALGHTYGCRDVWSFYVPSDRPPTRDVDMYWRDALHLPGARQLRHWRRLFETYPWHRLAPDGEGRLITHGTGDGRANVSTPAALADDASFALAYLPLRMPVWVDLSQLHGASGTAVDALWYDPRTGQERFVQRYHERGVVRFFPPGEQSQLDWVLVLRTGEWTAP